VGRGVVSARYDRGVSEPEVVDGLPVLREPDPEPATAIERVRPAGPVAVQAAAVAGASFVAGATAIAMLRGRKARKSNRRALRIGRGRRGRRLDVVGTRSFLVDVHFVDRH
jgi:hypothetical protein